MALVNRLDGGIEQKMFVQKSHPAVGARITGIDLSGPITEGEAQQIRDAFTEHAVLCFPGQKVTGEDQSRFASLFGEVDTASRASENPDKKQSLRGVMYVSNIRENGQPIGVLPDGEMHFHSDGAHRSIPYRATTLFAIEVPSYGGDTKFAGLVKAFASLPKDIKKSIEGLKAKHVFNYNKTTREEMRQDDEDVAFAIHPLVKQHPNSGQKSIYLSRLMTREIVGLEPEESENLLLFLFDHCEQSQFVYSHKWTPGDLVIWDNRCVNHARSDFPGDQRRLLRRYTVSEPD